MQGDLVRLYPDGEKELLEELSFIRCRSAVSCG
jgi:hypothetical protein